MKLYTFVSNIKSILVILVTSVILIFDILLIYNGGDQYYIKTIIGFLLISTLYVEFLNIYKYIPLLKKIKNNNELHDYFQAKSHIQIIKSILIISWFLLVAFLVISSLNNLTEIF